MPAEAVASGHFEDLDERMAAVCSYALKLTIIPSEMRPRDVDRLRQVGLTDRDIVDANQVTSYFNYVNRVADGLGVELEAYWPAHLRKKRRYRLREKLGFDGGTGRIASPGG